MQDSVVISSSGANMALTRCGALADGRPGTPEVAPPRDSPDSLPFGSPAINPTTVALGTRISGTDENLADGGNGGVVSNQAPTTAVSMAT